MTRTRGRAVLTDDIRNLPVAVQVQLTVITPFLAGAICGFLAGVSALAFWGWQVLATLGSVSGGSEHRRTRHALLRGGLAGTVFGAGLVVAHRVSGDPAVVPLPSPAALTILVTAGVGAAAGSCGARVRRLVQRAPDPPPV